MLAKLLNLLILGLVSVAMDNNIHTTEEQIALCVETIVDSYFTRERPILVSMPTSEKAMLRSLVPLSSYKSKGGLVSLTLSKLHENAGWTIRSFTPLKKATAGVEIPQSYIIFIWSEDDDSDIMECVKTQVDGLRESEGAAWNPEGKFLIIVTEPDDTASREMALQIYADLWEQHSIADATVLTPSRVTGMEWDTLEFYTGFPYESGNCGKVTQVTLMDQWHINNNEGFTSSVNLFPPKIPKNFRGCEIRVASVVLPPFVMLAGNSTHSDGSIEYNLQGLAVHYFLLLAEKINTTVVFLSPSYGFTEQNALIEGGALASGMSDILIGAVLLLPVFLSSTFLPTVPYRYVTMKLYVPCPKPVAGTERVITTYEVSVWLTMATVFILMNVVWWCIANWRYRSLKEPATFQTLSHCFYTAWAVTVGVSVPKMPNTWNLRCLFLLYVCYCFAMSTVFQAFFFSYLVQPGYGKRFETLDEVLHSNVFYGYNELDEIIMDMAGYKEHRRFPSSRRVDCSDMMKCLQRIVTDADLCTLSASPFIQYLSNQMGIHDATKYLCALEEYMVTTGFISVFRNGSPHLNRFNTLTVQVLEAGLLDRYWTELIWNVRLRSEKRIDDDDENMYFVFSLSHISPAFFVLMLGCVFSAVVFLSEIFFKKIRELQKCAMFNRPRVSPF
jgi:hypothetical protein